ncbi:MAG: hypothetical protein EBR85_03840 [Betaproteobacteria bacterium]|nr:hypothetical protein [Betaproteobacteria bacterium]
MGNKFDLTNAAWSELDIDWRMLTCHVGFTIGLSPLRLFTDLPMQLAQACHDIEVKVAPKHKGPNNIVKAANRMLKC